MDFQFNPDKQYLLPANTEYTDADTSNSYAEQFAFSAKPGSGVQDAGYVEYVTLVYDPSTQSDYFAYNDSGTATLNTVVENYVNS